MRQRMDAAPGNCNSPNRSDVSRAAFGRPYSVITSSIILESSASDIRVGV